VNLAKFKWTLGHTACATIPSMACILILLVFGREGFWMVGTIVALSSHVLRNITFTVVAVTALILVGSIGYLYLEWSSFCFFGTIVFYAIIRGMMWYVDRPFLNKN